jgi:hypothetical protein
LNIICIWFSGQKYNFFIQIGKKASSNLPVSEKNSNFALAKDKKGD